MRREASTYDPLRRAHTLKFKRVPHAGPYRLPGMRTGETSAQRWAVPGDDFSGRVQDLDHNASDRRAWHIDDKRQVHGQANRSRSPDARALRRQIFRFVAAFRYSRWPLSRVSEGPRVELFEDRSG